MTKFVLIHGAYQGGWIWGPVATRLRAEGHVVYAPSLDGCGERVAQLRTGITTESQADEIANLVFYEDLADVVLVGTSSGGMVMAKIAELERERVARLVFVDALALMNGEKIRDIVTRPAPINTEPGSSVKNAYRLACLVAINQTTSCNTARSTIGPTNFRPPADRNSPTQATIAASKTKEGTPMRSNWRASSGLGQLGNAHNPAYPSLNIHCEPNRAIR